MSDIVTIPAKRLKLAGAGFTAEKDVSRMSRESWLKLRYSGLGGTDMAAIMFPDDNKGPLSVYVEKVGGMADDFEGNDFTDYGRILEESLRNTFLPTKLLRMGYQAHEFEVSTSPYFYRSTTHPWMTANVDGLIRFDIDMVLEDGTYIPAGLYVLELKTASMSQRHKWEGGSIPDRYYAQAQHYVSCLNLSGAVIFSLVDRAPELRFIPRNDDFAKLHLEMGTEMWTRIATNNPPPAFGGTADLSALQEVYPNAGSAMIQSPGLEELATEYLNAMHRMKTAESDVKAIRAQLESSIGSNGGLVDGDSTVKWSRWETVRVDYKQLEADNPDLVARYKTKKTPGNRLTVKVKGREEE